MLTLRNQDSNTSKHPTTHCTRKRAKLIILVRITDKTQIKDIDTASVYSLIGYKIGNNIANVSKSNLLHNGVKRETKNEG